MDRFVYAYTSHCQVPLPHPYSGQESFAETAGAAAAVALAVAAVAAVVEEASA